MPRPQRIGRSYKRFDREDTIHHSSIRLMECFETPPKRTIFGSKNSEHWDSFQSKYSSSFDSNHHFEDRDQHYLTQRKQRKQQTRNRDDAVQPSSMRQRDQGRNKKWIVWLLISCCGKSSTTMRSERSHEFEIQRHQDRRKNKITEIQRKKSIPLVERYSDYFERRRFR